METAKRLKNIDVFFQKLSIEEFETILMNAGIKEIKSLSSVNMEMVTPSSKVPYTTNSYYLNTIQGKYIEYEPNKDIIGAA